MFYIQFIQYTAVTQSVKTMGSQTSKSQQEDEVFSNHSSINFVSEEATDQAELSSSKGVEMTVEEINLLGEKCSFSDLSLT